MKKFFILVLFSLLFSIQNTSAVSPSLDETIEFLVNGNGYSKYTWFIKDCNLTYIPPPTSIRDKQTIDLNKVDLNSFKTLTFNGREKGFEAGCIGVCRIDGGKERDFWVLFNGASWKRNKKALTHLFSNFCSGAKTAF